MCIWRTIFWWLILLFQVGTLIYTRIVKANTGMNPELSCMDGWCFFKLQKKFLYFLSYLLLLLILKFPLIQYSFWKSCRVWPTERWLYVWIINWFVTDVRFCFGFNLQQWDPWLKFYSNLNLLIRKRQEKGWRSCCMLFRLELFS